MFKKSIITAFIMSCGLLLNSSVFAQANYNYSVPIDNQNQSSLFGYAIFVPAGITCDAVLSHEINSLTAVVGQNIDAVLVEDFYYNNTLIAPAGSVINGSIVSMKKARFANRNAQMQIRFTTIRTPYNNTIPISATIATDNSSGVLKAGTSKDTLKDYAKDTTIGAGSGAVLGTAMGALSGGSVGKGAIYGTALGAGMGIIKSTCEKGENIIIPPNSKITLYFDQPITLGAK